MAEAINVRLYLAERRKSRKMKPPMNGSLRLAGHGLFIAPAPAMNN